MNLDWECPCWVKGCKGKWQSVFLGFIAVGTRAPRTMHEITCTVGGDEHVRRFLQPMDLEVEPK